MPRVLVSQDRQSKTKPLLILKHKCCDYVGNNFIKTEAPTCEILFLIFVCQFWCTFLFRKKDIRWRLTICMYQKYPFVIFNRAFSEVWDKFYKIPFRPTSSPNQQEMKHWDTYSSLKERQDLFEEEADGCNDHNVYYWNLENIINSPGLPEGWPLPPWQCVEREGKYHQCWWLRWNVVVLSSLHFESQFIMRCCSKVSPDPWK